MAIMLDDSWSVGAIDFKLGLKNLCVGFFFSKILQKKSETPRKRQLSFTKFILSALNPAYQQSMVWLYRKGVCMILQDLIYE